jgi:hypothetical protein
MTSWKTTLGGALAALGTFLWGVPIGIKTAFPEFVLDPEIVKWCVLGGIIASGGGVLFMGLFGRDNNVTSEQVQAAKEKPPTGGTIGTGGLGVWLMLGLCALMLGCGGLPNAVVTVTSVVDAGMKEWAKASNDGRTTPKIDADVREAHVLYREAAGRAATLYETALNTGDASGRLAALKTIKEAADLLLDELIPAVGTPRVADLQLKLEGAQAP